jgi:hypothetical protein
MREPGCILTSLVKEEDRIRPWEDSNQQKWKIETQYERFGFRHLSSGLLLGAHFFGNVFAVKRQLNDWELFTLHPVGSGYVFELGNQKTPHSVERPVNFLSAD